MGKALRAVAAGGDAAACVDTAIAEGIVPITTARARRGITRLNAPAKAIFFETLALTSNVAAAIRASGASETNVYRQRQKSAEFRAEWQAALSEGYVRLEAMMLERALNGVERTVWHGGQAVGTMREYSDRLGLALLAQHRASVRGERADPRPAEETEEQVRARQSARFSEMNRRMGGAG